MSLHGNAESQNFRAGTSAKCAGTAAMAKCRVCDGKGKTTDSFGVKHTCFRCGGKGTVSR